MYLRFLLRITACFLFSLQLHAQPFWSDVFEKSHDKFRDGKFKSARKKYKKVLKTIRKEYNNAPLLREGWLPIDAARTHEALGQFPSMERQLKAGIQKLEARREDNPEHYAQGVMWAASVYLRYGNYVRVGELLSPFDSLIKNELLPPYIAHEMQLYRTRTLTYQGYLDEAQKRYAGLPESYRQVLEQAGISEAEKRHRRETMARILLLEAEIYAQRGDYPSARDLLLSKEAEIEALVPKDSEVFGQYLMLVADSFHALNAFKEADRYYRKATREAHKTRLVAKILVRDAQNQFADNNEGKARSAANNLKSFGKKVKSKENSYLVMSKVLEAEFAHAKEDHEKAIKLLDEVREYDRSVLPREHPVRYEENLLRTEASLARREWRKAKYALNFATEIHAKLYGAESPAHEFVKLRQAHFYLKYTPDRAEAFEKRKKVNTGIIFQTYAPFHPYHHRSLQLLADFVQEEERYKLAITYRQKARDILSRKYGKRSGRAAREQVRLAELYTLTGVYDKADRFMRRALPLIADRYDKSSAAYLEATRTYAVLLTQVGRYDEAQKLLRKNQRRSDAEDFEAAEKLALLYEQSSNYTESEELLTDVLRRKTALYGERSVRLAQPLHQLGRLAVAMGDYETAENRLNRAAELARNDLGEKSLRYAAIRRSQAKRYASLGDYVKAERITREALQIYESRLDSGHIATINTLTQLALIRFAEGTEPPETVTEDLQRARQMIVLTFGEQHPLHAEALKNLAVFHISQQNYDQAISMLRQAEAVWSDYFGNKNRNSGEAYMLLGTAFSGKGYFREARKSYQQAEKILEKHFDRQHPSFVKTLSKNAQMHYVNSEYKQANKIMEEATAIYFNFLKTYFPALSEGEKARFWAMIRPDFEFFNSLATSRAERRPDFLGKMYNHSLATKGILLSTSARIKRTILSGNDAELKQYYREWLAAKERLKTLLAMDAEERATQQGRLDAIQKEVDRLEKVLSQRGIRGMLAEPADWKEIRKALEKDEAAVEIIRYRQYEKGFTDKIRYACLILTRKTRSAPRLVLLDNGYELENKHFNHYRNMMDYEIEDLQSYQRFWAPVAEAIAEEGDIRRVYLCADGVYNQISVSSLQSGSGTFVLDNTDIISVTNGREITRLKEKEQNAAKRSGKEVVLFSNPQFYTSEKSEQTALATRSNNKPYISPLPGTTEEVEQIARLMEQKKLRPKVLTGEQAQEAYMEQFQFGESPRIFHVATHGFFGELSEAEEATQASSDVLSTGYHTPSPLLRSGLLMSGAGDLLLRSTAKITTGNGILTAYEVMNLNFNDTELVVLSACETGRGEVRDGEGVFGLQRAFLVAGADALIISLFKVSDAVTQELMVTFYRNWFEKGMSKREAFMAAQRSIRKRYPEPIYWGAFKLISG